MSLRGFLRQTEVDSPRLMCDGRTDPHYDESPLNGVTLDVPGTLT